MPENVITRWECERCGTGWVDAGTTVVCQADFTVCGARAERHYVAVDTLHEWIEERRIAVSPETVRGVWGQGYRLALGDLAALLEELETGGKS